MIRSRLVAVLLPIAVAACASLALGAPLLPRGQSSHAPLPRTSAPPPASALAREGFVRIGKAKGVTIYRRDVRPGIDLAAEGDIAASPDRVYRVLLDYSNHKRWQKHLKEYRILARGDGFLYVYERLELPFLDDRDFTLRVAWGDDGGVRWTRFETANDHGPKPKPGVVRLTQHEGSWRLEPIAGGASVHATCRMYIDIASSLSWMGKTQAVNELMEVFASVAQQATDRRVESALTMSPVWLGQTGRPTLTRDQVDGKEDDHRRRDGSDVAARGRSSSEHIVHRVPDGV